MSSITPAKLPAMPLCLAAAILTMSQACGLKAIPRPAAGLLITGGLIGPLALTTPFQIPLAVGIAWAGFAKQRGAPTRKT